jgi:predicted nucleic acid-binding protein
MSQYFLDTNILIYAYSKTEPNKADQANALLFEGNSLISSQIINEFANVCLRKLQQNEKAVIAAILEIASSTRIVGCSLATQLQALELRQKYSFSYYDALVVASALENNCTTLFSEDMQHN